MRLIAIPAAVMALSTPAAAADFVRLADVPPDDDVAVSGGAVVSGSTPDGGTSTLTAYGLDGSARGIPLPARHSFVEELVASDGALAAIVFGGSGEAAYFGPPSGPLRRLPRTFVDVAVTGDRVVSLHGRFTRGPGTLQMRDVGAGTTKRIELPTRDVGVVTAAGRFAAYLARFASAREAAVVVDLRSGRERYRVRTPAEGGLYGLAPSGRLWFLERGRVLTATPHRPRPRTVARLRLNPYELGVARHQIAVVHDIGRGRSRIVLVRPDGRRRRATPELPAIEALAYDGATLAFGAGGCVFGGRVPSGSPQPIRTDGC